VRREEEASITRPPLSDRVPFRGVVDLQEKGHLASGVWRDLRPRTFRNKKKHMENLFGSTR